jgi:KaiC/GvpD/RAD55 family RecA-like ATPase
MIRRAYIQAMLPPKIRGCVFLDYPLDILLNRECKLSDYEKNPKQAMVYIKGVATRFLNTVFPDLEKKTLNGKEESAFLEILRDFTDKLYEDGEVSPDKETAGASSKTAEADASQRTWKDKRANLLKELKRRNRGAAESQRKYLAGLIEKFGDSSVTLDELRYFQFPADRPARSLPPAELRGDYQNSLGSLRLPTDAHPGTGNIVIRGNPGSGKSTLALQLAMSMAFEPNNFSTVYIALEEPVENVIAKFRQFSSWENRLRVVNILGGVDESTSSEAAASALRKFFTQPRDKCRHKASCEKDLSDTCADHVDDPEAAVLFPLLSPREITQSADGSDDLFWARFKQLERLLQAARWERERDGIPDIRAVCIDSLNVFGSEPMDRNKVFRLFDLFKQYRTIGIFTVDDTPSTTEIFSSEVVDVLIDLTAESDYNYAVRYFEIVKSRYQHQVYGKHPFKIRSEQASGAHGGDFVPIKIFPSLHHIVAATSNAELMRDPDEFDIGDDGLEAILTKSFKRNSVLAVQGPSGTFKSSIARNFLIRGIVNDESVLYIQLHERPSFSAIYTEQGVDKVAPWMMSLDRYEPRDGIKVDWYGFKSIEDEEIINPKMIKKTYQYQNEQYLIELSLKGGALLPEEFLDIVRGVFRNLKTKGKNIRRVVIDDISKIGVSYPLLKQSRTSGDLFLPSFIHVIRNFGIETSVDLLMVGTFTGVPESDNIVNRAASLADTVLCCEFRDVFGAQYVTVFSKEYAVRKELRKGGGGKEADYFENIPGVILPMTYEYKLRGKGKECFPRCFKVDLDKLKGLVGIDSGNIHRPGLSLKLFADGIVQRRYNREIERMMRAAFGYPQRADNAVPDSKNARDVSIINFDSASSEAVHDSLRVLGGGPIERTILCTVDEFFLADREESNGKTEESLICLDGLIKEEIGGPGKEDDPVAWRKYLDKFFVNMPESGVFAVPYSANLLVLAYRKDCKELADFPRDYRRMMSWSTVAGYLSTIAKLPKEGRVGGSADGGVPGILYPMDHDVIAAETMSCALMDAIITGTLRANPALGFVVEKAQRKGKGKNEFVFPILARTLDFFRKQKIPYDAKKTERAIKSELRSLHKIFSLSQKYSLRNGDLGEAKKNEKALCPNAAMYLCWYSQLRDLLQQHPALSSQMRIVALPSGGFSGDWFLGIGKGSVSVKLGYDVIKILCGETEEFKRFVRGVGLPVTERFNAKDQSGKEFYLGPYSTEPLHEIIELHKKAYVRSRIKDYEKYRAFLTTIGQQLSQMPSAAEAGEFIDRSYKRIPGIITDVFTRSDSS